MRRALFGVVAGVLMVVVGCGASDRKSTLLIAVDAPFGHSSYVGGTVANGTLLAVREINQAGGMTVGGSTYSLRVRRFDNAQSPSKAVRDVRRAIADHAVAIVTDGTGVDAAWHIADKAHVPMCIVYDGGMGLVDATGRPNVFRIAPTNHGIAFRYAEYLIPKGLRVAFLTDDTAYGRSGRAALDHAFAKNPEAVATKIEVPGTATDLAPQMLEARRRHATALLVWAQPAAIAEAVIAARTLGWSVPIYTSPSGEDPLVRQELANHPDWVDGLTFAAGRMTAEIGAAPFTEFRHRYELAFGKQKVGVDAPDGTPVVEPPDYSMYPYDCVNLLAAAVRAARTTDGTKVIGQLNQVSAEGANGDLRGFNEHSHEGVVDDDIYFARFHGMRYFPVKDDALSATLPKIDQQG